MGNPLTPASAGAGAIVEFRGGVAATARAFHDSLQRAIPDVGLTELPEGGGPLGVGTIFITLLVVSAMKAMMKVAVDALEQEYERRRDGASAASSMQITLKMPGEKTARFPPFAPAPIAGDYGWKAAFETLREIIGAL